MSGSSETNLQDVANQLKGVTYEGTNLIDVQVTISNGTYTVTSTNPTHNGDGSEPFMAVSTSGGAEGPDPTTELQVNPQAYGGGVAFYYQVVAYSSAGVLLEKLTGTTQQPYNPPRYTVISGASDGGPPTVAAGDTFGATGTPTIPPCFVTGSRILTTRGEVAVEELAVGDVAIAASGAERAIVWIGHRTVSPGRRAELQPVCVAAGAFADGLPNADLWLSPGHSVFADGVLIPVSFLINGVTITQHSVPSVTYWHVELDAHDIVVSQGLPSESYLDTGNRLSFANGGAAVAMAPDFAPAASELSCAPLVQNGLVLAAVRERLLGRIAAFGYVEAEHEGLRILADGAPVAALKTGRTLRVSVPAGTTRLSLISSSGVPSHHEAQSSDTRRLGVAIDGLRIGGTRALAEIGLDDLRLGAGFHPIESNAQTRWRWTDGNATMSLAAEQFAGRALVVEIDVMPTALWVDYVATVEAASTRLAG